VTHTIHLSCLEHQGLLTKDAPSYAGHGECEVGRLMSFCSPHWEHEGVREGQAARNNLKNKPAGMGYSGHDDERGVSPNATSLSAADNRMTVRIELRLEGWLLSSECEMGFKGFPHLNRMAMPCNIIFLDRIHANAMALLLHGLVVKSSDALRRPC